MNREEFRAFVIKEAETILGEQSIVSDGVNVNVPKEHADNFRKELEKEGLMWANYEEQEYYDWIIFSLEDRDIAEKVANKMKNVFGNDERDFSIEDNPTELYESLKQVARSKIIGSKKIISPQDVANLAESFEKKMQSLDFDNPMISEEGTFDVDTTVTDNDRMQYLVGFERFSDDDM